MSHSKEKLYEVCVAIDSNMQIAIECEQLFVAMKNNKEFGSNIDNHPSRVAIETILFALQNELIMSLSRMIEAGGGNRNNILALLKYLHNKDIQEYIRGFVDGDKLIDELFPYVRSRFYSITKQEKYSKAIRLHRDVNIAHSLDLKKDVLLDFETLCSLMRELLPVVEDLIIITGWKKTKYKVSKKEYEASCESFISALVAGMKDECK